MGSDAIELEDDVRLFLGSNKGNNIRALECFMPTRDDLCQDASATVHETLIKKIKNLGALEHTCSLRRR